MAISYVLYALHLRLLVFRVNYVYAE